RQFELIPQRVREQVMWGSAGCAAGNTNQSRLVIVGRGDGGLLLRVPPFVGYDAVPVAVCPGQQGCMSGRGAGVGVVVIAVSKVRAMFEQKSKASLTPLVAIAFQIVGAKLVDHNDDHQLRPGVVSGTIACGREGKAE